MFPLFEVSKLLKLQKSSQSSHSGCAKLLQHCFKQYAERSQFAVYISNGLLLLWSQLKGQQAVTKKIVWYPGRDIVNMTFDPAGSWLLCACSDARLCVVPFLAVLEPSTKIEKNWKTDDVTSFRLPRNKGDVSALTWWNTFGGDHIALIGTTLGVVLFVDLRSGTLITKVYIKETVTQMELVSNEARMFTFVLINTSKVSQWKLLLEHTEDKKAAPKPTLSNPTKHKEQTVMTQTILQNPDEKEIEFFPVKLHQFPRHVTLRCQAGKGQRLISAHDRTTNICQIVSSSVDPSPVYIFQLPPDTGHVYITDKLVFATCATEIPSLLILAKQQLAASGEQFDDKAILQKFDFPRTETILGVYRSRYPSDWLEKKVTGAPGTRDSAEVCREPPDITSHTGSVTSLSAVGQHQSHSQDSISVSSHTLLDGVTVVTTHCLYDCKPRVSPERLFVNLAASAERDWKESGQLGKMLGLDTSRLYLSVAQHKLQLQDLTKATKLFQLAKCALSMRTKMFMKYGRLAEALTYGKQVLQIQNEELTIEERIDLANTVVSCFVQLLLESGMKNSSLAQEFKDFLVSDFSYNDNFVLKLLLKYNMQTLLLDFAKAKKKHAGLLQLILERTDYQPTTLYKLLKATTQQNTPLVKFLVCLEVDDVANILMADPKLAPGLLHGLEDIINDLDPDTILRLAYLFDPSQPAMKRLLLRALQKTTVDWCLTDSGFGREIHNEGHDNPLDASDLIDLFMNLLITLNSKRQAVFLDIKPPVSHIPEDKVTGPAKRYLCNKSQPIACGQCHAVVISNNKVKVFGKMQNKREGGATLNEKSSYPPETPFSGLPHLLVHSVSCGAHHSLAITDSGVYGWGRSDYGQVGVGGRGFYSQPLMLNGLSDERVVSVVCGQYHSAALTQDFRLWTWGWGVHGQLGHSTTDDQLVPTVVRWLCDLSVVTVAAGYAHTIVTTSRGLVYSFGCGTFGQLGLGSTDKQTLPQLVQGLSDPVKFVATKCFHNLAVTANNKLYTWGASPHQLRNIGVSARRARPSGQQVENDSCSTHLIPSLIDTSIVDGTIIQAVCGSNFNILLSEDGEVFSWGKNFDGQLGIGNRMDEKFPTMVVKINDRKVTQVAAGLDFVIASDNSGQRWGWGNNTLGQLGEQFPENAILEDMGFGNDVFCDLLHPTLLEQNKDDLHAPPIYRKKKHTSAQLWWIEERSCEEEALLYLKEFALNDGNPFPPGCVLQLIQILPGMCNSAALLRRSRDHEAWLIAALISQHLRLHSQSFHYHSRYIQTKRNSLTDVDNFCCEVVQYYLSLVIYEQKPTSVRNNALERLLTQIFQFWCHENLCMKSLERLLLQHIDDLALSVFSVLSHGNKLDEKPPEPEIKQGSLLNVSDNLSTEFCLKLTSNILQKLQIGELSTAYVLQNITQVTPDCLQDFQPTEVPDLTLQDTFSSPQQLWDSVMENARRLKANQSINSAESMAQCCNVSDRNIETGSTETPSVNKLDKPNLITDNNEESSPEKCNKSKSLPDAVAVCDKVSNDRTKQSTTHVQIDVKRSQHKDENKVTDRENNEIEPIGDSERLGPPVDKNIGSNKILQNKDNSVAFTCGHDYQKEAFLHITMPNLEQEMPQSTDHSQLRAVALLTYYSRSDLKTLACPECVLKAIHALS